MSNTATVGIDVGTSSTKGVLVALDGTILATATRTHRVDHPRPGHAEMDPAVWWDEAVAIIRELLAAAGEHTVAAVGVSGMGPCVVLTDDAGAVLRPAILYGVDTRATAQIARLTGELGGADAIREQTGSALSTQSVGPKLAWLAEHEPDVWARARRLFMPASWLGRQLTGAYYLDQHSASQCTPMYDAAAQDWHPRWAAPLAGPLTLPPLVWPADVIGTVSAAAAAQTGLAAGTPVVAGTIDAWTEAVSVGAHRLGDLMLMYGTTMFLVHTTAVRNTSPVLWGTTGAFPGTRNLAAGMATSGAVTSWLHDLVGAPGHPQLLAEAAASGPGAGGLLMLPYFAGERTPIADPDARGVIAGLTLRHTRGDLYRAALEATAFGVRHNIDAIEAAGGRIDRIVAVGGGTQGRLWPQIVADVTGRPQLLPEKTIGAAYGTAFLAAGAVDKPDIEAWNPIVERIEPDPPACAAYDPLYRLYVDLYPATAPIAHALAGRS
ncbi:FGGY family carbohydrate kinase [Dactylosporangium sp. AC04546]|uniref:FGGY-family carbohydrate kinase n=1 Tax=Dactylosporangium sp. AC04546 TaxID=2862460 RepID=UPI001EDF0175|nr:FGGY family carbohydrate kinase [Dactylosporangium sp. AC04546]WVK78488.1 FGGY family carbohydrate kinase [Dactylosporangium sp. AC04546]